MPRAGAIKFPLRMRCASRSIPYYQIRVPSHAAQPECSSSGVNQQILDRCRLLAVGSVFRHVLDDLVRRFASFEANPFNSAESDGNTADQSRAETLPRKAFDLDDESELRE